MNTILNSIQRFLAFCVTVRNGLFMPKQEVAFPGFSGLLAFGMGVAVGANWPRASNFVGFILQRLRLRVDGPCLVDVGSGKVSSPGS